MEASEQESAGKLVDLLIYILLILWSLLCTLRILRTWVYLRYDQISCWHLMCLIYLIYFTRLIYFNNVILYME